MFRILVAEDNALNRMVLTRLLTGMGCIVDTAEDGNAVLAVVVRERYDLVLMDVRMPKMDGIAATRAMRQLLAAACPPVYAVTAGVSNEERAECLAAGMAGFIAKPVQSEELRALISHLQS